MAKLVYHDSDGVDKTLALGVEPVLIGRATECEIQTHDAMVSRKHARIVWDGNGYVVEDLGSSNGVFLGADKVQRAPLRSGDVVTCGSLVLRLVAQAPSGEPRAATPLGGVNLPPEREYDEAAITTDQRERLPPAAKSPDELPRLREELRREAERREQAESALRYAEQKASSADAAARELSALRRRLEQVQGQLESQRAAPRSGAGDEELAEALALFNDALAELKVTLRAGADESELLTTPVASVRLVRESIRSAMDDVEKARDRLRQIMHKLGLR